MICKPKIPIMEQYDKFSFTLVTDPGPSIYSTAGSISGTPVS
jgi:hypothetical protein